MESYRTRNEPTYWVWLVLFLAISVCSVGIHVAKENGWLFLGCLTPIFLLYGFLILSDGYDEASLQVHQQKVTISLRTLFGTNTIEFPLDEYEDVLFGGRHGKGQLRLRGGTLISLGICNAKSMQIGRAIETIRSQSFVPEN
jgi:hypothetical protein